MAGTCPENQHMVGDTCDCNDEYVWNAESTECVEDPCLAAACSEGEYCQVDWDEAEGYYCDTL